MSEHGVKVGDLEAFGLYLRSEERSVGTVEKYLRDVRQFVAWLSGTPVSKEAACRWEDHLLSHGRQASTVNAMLSALHRFLSFLGWEECRVRYLRRQRQVFRDAGRELTRQDYVRLLETAHSLGRTRLALLLESICSRGIRVSEVQYLTVEAARSGRAEVALKGKSAPSSCREGSAVSYSSTHGSKKPLLVESSSPKAANISPDARSGPR